MKGKNDKQLVYLDCHASTPCDPRVLDAMLPHFCDAFANPSSAVHQAGLDAGAFIEQARERVAKAIGAEPTEVIFTGSATESNAIVLLGIICALRDTSSRRTILTLPIEHKSILENCRALAERGFIVDRIPVDSRGRAILDEVRKLMTDDVLLVCTQMANNEIGTIQPIADIVSIAHANDSLVLCDAAQALGRVALDVSHLSVDFLSLSAHKAYGPKGIGGLYIKGGANQSSLTPIYYGGGQEFGLRSGTHNVPGIVGFGVAAEIAARELATDKERMSSLRDRLEAMLTERIPSLRVNGDTKSRLSGNSSLSFPGVDSLALISNAPTLMISNGSACDSGTPEPSYVLIAIGLLPDEAECTIRIGLGRFTTDDDVKHAVERLYDSYQQCLAP